MNVDEKFNKFLEGYAVPDPMQSPPGKPHDPQIVALHQYLQTKHGLKSNDALLDFGSGLGIVASVMEAIWPETSSMPWYYAVDRVEVLNKLALSPALHNHSRKIDSDTFFNNGFEQNANEVKTVVIRNVFHELDICTTAHLLYRLRSLLIPQTEVYIQDVVNLPRGERARVGWHPDLLTKVLQFAGFQCVEPVCLSSFDGTKWFTIVAHQVATKPSPLVSIEKAVVSERSRQRELITEKLQKLSEACDEATSHQYVLLQTEEAALSTQLQQYSYVARSRSSSLTQSYLAGIPLVLFKPTNLDYAEEMPEDRLSRSGLVAVLSSKNQIDFPSLLSNCKQKAYFMGYSQRSLFQNEETKTGITKALRNNVDFKVLLVDPMSEVVKARAKSLAYANYQDLVSDIEFTIKAYKVFCEEMEFPSGSTPCYIKLFDSIPPSSFFIIDELCFVSLYSTRLSGGSGPCLVFRNDTTELNAYYSVLLQEFNLAWDGALNV